MASDDPFFRIDLNIGSFQNKNSSCDSEHHYSFTFMNIVVTHLYL